MKTLWKVLIVIAVIVVAALLCVGQYIGWKNRLVELDENTKSAWGQLESQL